MEHVATAPEPDTFRRLVEGEIGVDEYVDSLDERVRERREHERETPPSDSPRRDAA